MNGGVVPGGDALSNLVQAWRNVGVGAVKNYQRFFAALHRLPVRIRLGHVAAHYDLTFGFFYQEREVSGEGNSVCIGYQDGKWICPHEGEDCGAVFLAVKFWYVHFSVSNVRATRRRVKIASCPPERSTSGCWHGRRLSLRHFGENSPAHCRL